MLTGEFDVFKDGISRLPTNIGEISFDENKQSIKIVVNNDETTISHLVTYMADHFYTFNIKFKSDIWTITAKL